MQTVNKLGIFLKLLYYLSRMKIKVVIDNISKNTLLKEWGLCIYIEHNQQKFLLDSGSSTKFAKNAQSLGIDLSQIDFGILSHAHYDHSNGMTKFFKMNKTAPFILRHGSGENCYHHVFWIINKYIGIKKGCLKKYAKRITFAEGNYQIADGVFLLPHSTDGLEQIGKRAKLYIKENKHIVPDSFKHEQSLIFDTDKGLVIFNSCSHGGADNIIKETSAAFPDKKIYGIIGGFHLFHLPDSAVRDFASRVEETGIKHIITGHCTGQRAFEILREELGDKVLQMYSGMEIEI